MDQTSIYRRHREKNGRLARKYGNTYIRTLRVMYGLEFALASVLNANSSTSWISWTINRCGG
jgi:hypothetical protein